MFLIDDIVKGFSQGTATGVGQVIDSIIKDFKVTPEQQVALEKMKADLELGLATIEQKGLDSARAREVSVKDQTPARLAYLSIGIFALLAMSVIYSDIPPNSHDIVVAMLSWVGGFVSSAFLYYFGSSHGSKEKDAIITAMANSSKA